MKGFGRLQGERRTGGKANGIEQGEHSLMEDQGGDKTGYEGKNKSFEGKA
jgi:hypothetical protein